MKKVLGFLSILLTFNLASGQQVISYQLDNHDRVKVEPYADSISIKYTYDSVGNIRTLIIENPCQNRPNPVITHATPLIFCQGDSVRLFAPVSIGYKWSRGDTTQFITVKQSGTFFVTTFNTLNCNKTSDSVIVIVNPLPQPKIDTSGITAFCKGLNVTLTSTLTGKYLWNTNDSTKSIIADSTKNYTLIYTDSNGCKATVSKQITVFPKPQVSFTTNNSNQCINGNNYIFTNTSNVPQGTLFFKWELGEGLPDSNTNTVHNYSIPGNFTVKLKATSDHGCIDSTSTPISIYPKPNVGFTINNSYQCFKNNQFNFTDTSKISNLTTLSTLWRFGDNTTSSSSITSKAYSTSGVYSVKLISTSTNNCRDSVTKSISVYSQPGSVIASINSTVFCQGLKDTLQANTGSGLNYQWLNNGVQIPSAINPIYVASSTGIYKVIVSNSNNCIDTSNGTAITVNPMPSLGFTINNPIQCLNPNNFIFTDTSKISSGTIQPLWNFGNGDTTMVKNPTKSYLSANSYFVKLVETSISGCKDSLTKQITVNPKPSPGFTINNPVQCLNGNSYQFTDTSTITGGTINRLWSLGSGDTSTIPTPSKVFSSPNTYNIKLLEVSNNGCKDSITKTVTVNPKPTVGFTQNNFNQCFTGNTFSLLDTSSITSGTINRNWNFGDNSFSTQLNPTKTYSNPGTYNIKIVQTSGFGCKDSVTKSFTVYPQTNIGFTLNNSNQCLSGNSYTFTDTSVISTGTFNRLWRLGDGSTSNANPTNKSYINDGSYIVNLITTSNNGCIDSIQKSITIYPQPKTGFTQNNFNQCFSGNSFNLNDTSNITSGSINRLWSFNGQDTTSIKTFTKNFLSADIYNVKIVQKSNFNCRDSVTKVFTVYPQNNVGFTINNPNQCYFGNSFLFTDTSALSSIRLWKLGNGDTSTSFLVNKIYSKDSTYLVKLNTTTINGCKDSIQKTVIVYPQPKAGFTQNNFSQCFTGNNFIFNDTSSIVSGSSNRLWSFNNMDTSAIDSFPKSFLNPGTYSVKLLHNSNFGCKDSVIKLFRIHPQTKIGFTINSIGQCLLANNFHFTDTSSNKHTRIWDLGNLTYDTSKIKDKTYGIFGQYVIKLTTTTDSNCVDTLSKTINVYPMPKSGFTINNSGQCVNTNNFILTDTTTINLGSYSRLWSFGDATFANDSIKNKQYSSANTYQIKLHITSNFNCQDSTVKNVAVYHKPNVEYIVNDSTQCVNGNNFSFASLSTVPDAQLTYKWNLGNDTLKIDSSFSFTYNLPGIYNVNMVATSDFGCKDSLSRVAYVYPNPNVNFTINTTIQCLKGNFYVFTDSSGISSGNIATHLWKFGDSSIASTINSNKSYSNPGSYNVKLILASDNGCFDSIAKVVKTNPQISLGFTINNPNQCQSGNNFQFTDTSNGEYIRKWLLGDLTIDSTDVVNKTYSAPNTYTVKLTSETSNGCMDTSIYNINVYPQQIIGFTKNNLSQCFRGNLFTFIDTSNLSTGATRLWQLGDSSNSNVDSINKSYNNPGTYSVKLFHTSVHSCKDSALISIYVYQQTNIGFTINDTDQCLTNNNFTFTDISSGAHSRNWNFGNLVMDTATTKNIQYANYGNYNVKLITNTSNDCYDTLQKNVVVFPMPKTNFTIDDSSQCLKGNNFQFSDSSKVSVGVINNYLWDFGDTTTATSSSLIKAFNQAAIYAVKLKTTSDYGCSDSVTKNVQVYPQLKTVISVGNNNSSQCFSGNRFFLVELVSDSSIIHSRIWQFGDGTTGFSKIEDKSYSKDSTYLVYLITTTNNGCIDTAQKTVGVLPQPAVGFEQNKFNQCLKGNLFILDDTSRVKYGSILNRVWSFNNTDTTGQPSLSKSFLIPNTYNIKLVVTTNNFCKDSISKNFIVYPQTDIGFSVSDSEQCLTGNRFQFNDTSIGQHTRIWDFGNLVSDTTIFKDINYITPGTYIVQLITETQFNCLDTLGKNVVVYPMPKANFNIDKPIQCLVGNYFTFTDSSLITNGNLTRIWKFDDGSSSTTSPTNKIYGKAMNYSIKLISVSDNECLDSVSKTVTLYLNPVKPLISRVGDTLISTVESMYQWYFDGNIIPGAVNRKYKPSQKGTYKVLVTNLNDCPTSSDTIYFIPTGLNQISNLVDFELYPNPNEGDFIVKSNHEINGIEIYNILGGLISQAPIQDNSMEQNLSLPVANGVYLLRIHTDFGIGLKRFVISR